MSLRWKLRSASISCLGIALLIAAASPLYAPPKGKKGKQKQAQKKEYPKVTEIFRLRRVGRGNAIETRELLLPIYAAAAEEYDVEVRKERAELKKAYRGQKVRVLRVLGEKDENGELYLCAYKGEPSVVSISGGPRNPGELTPALKIEADGSHKTEVTRIVPKANATPSGKPALEVVDDSDGGTVSFFGIPLIFDDGPAKKRKPAPKPAPESTKTEVKTLPKYRASVSTELLDEGPPFMSQALFLEFVKNGKIFTVKQMEKRRCQACRGFGRVKDTRPVGSRDPDGRMPCPDCEHIGKIEWEVTYLVAW